MELELIERLKSKQMEQRKAYQQLEAVLSLGSTRWVQGSDLHVITGVEVLDLEPDFH